MGALLDMLAEGDFWQAEGMKEDFISNGSYTSLVFDKVWQLKASDLWDQIDQFMGKEYMMEWIQYKNIKGDE